MYAGSLTNLSRRKGDIRGVSEAWAWDTGRVDEEIRGLGSGYELELVLVDLGRDVVDTLILDECRRGEEGLVADILQLFSSEVISRKLP